MAKKPKGVPTRHEQLRFLDLNSRRTSLWQLLKQAEHVEERHKEEMHKGEELPVAVLNLIEMVKYEYERADNEVKSFAKKHPSKAWAILDSDDIKAAFVDDDVEPLDV